jgi:hypothetical protein
MDNSRLPALVALTALVAGAVVALTQTHRRRRHGRSHTPPEHLQRWEGEGGGVPVSDGRTAASRVRAGTPSF